MTKRSSAPKKIVMLNPRRAFCTGRLYLPKNEPISGRIVCVRSDIAKKNSGLSKVVAE